MVWVLSGTCTVAYGVLFYAFAGMTAGSAIGVVVSRNITPHREHGIGAWTDEQIVRALLQGVSADGRKLTPPMSGRTSIWAQLSQRDLGDLVAYLRSLPPQGP